jgi:hypothetical protein
MNNSVIVLPPSQPNRIEPLLDDFDSTPSFKNLLVRRKKYPLKGSLSGEEISMTHVA